MKKTIFEQWSKLEILEDNLTWKNQFKYSKNL